ncbi:MAG: M48 family metalloprotease [Phycisphaera sp.]|nr:M48 family metalloprotease [Phycisphaera sp.]
MSTDFFTSQDRARRQTGRLVLLFVAGVLGTMVSLWAVLAALLSGSQGPSVWTNPVLPIGVFVVVGGIVGIVTLVKLAQLSMGGEKIAEMLGGRRIEPTTRDASERQLLNIVEEMSIASGVPVPPVYLMEDRSVNAFAAGPDPSRSVIGVTRGCMELLSRDELQGVVAHEYSHIFHGDTRINARTTAVIAGIMAVGILGYVMFRFIGPTIARSSGGGRNNPGPAIGLGILVLGLAVWGIGSIGMFFGRLIQAAISRQREFLADAAAVQYTRNPDGIAGALAKIRDHYSARVESRAASELNHFFFASSLNTLFATHPPIDERIRRIVAMGAVKAGAAEAARPSSAAAARPARARATGSRAGEAGFAGGPPPLPPRPAVQAVGLAGTLEPAMVARSGAWLQSLPPELADAVHRASGARGICYLIASRGTDGGGTRIVERDDPEAARYFHTLANALAQQTPVAQLALADLAAPALVTLGRQGYTRFRKTLAEVMRSDRSIDLREWALAKSLERHVERRFARSSAEASGRLFAMEAEARVVLAAIALCEHEASERASAFARGCRRLGIAERPVPPEPSLTLDALNAAVERLASLRFTDRERLLEASAATALHDGGADSNEYLVVRSVADALDVPVPALEPV